MTDPGLTDLIAAHQWIHFAPRRNSKCACGWQGDDPDYPSVGHPAHVAEALTASYIVIELPEAGGPEASTSPAQSVKQRTNGRLAELEAHAEYMGRELPNVAARIDSLTARAEKSEATIDRVRDALTIGPLHRLNFPKYKDPYAIDRHVIHAALEGE